MKYHRKNIVKLVLVLLPFLINSSFAKDLSDSWKLIKSDEISNIFINPLKIVEYGDEISVWAIERLKEPRDSVKNKKIGSIKTHYLFNKIKKRYAEIGVIYYGAKGGILNRSSKSSFNGGSSAFMTPISSNPDIEKIYNEAISFLITGKVTSLEVNNDENRNNTVSIEKNKDVEYEEESKKIVIEDLSNKNDLVVNIESSDNLKKIENEISDTSKSSIDLSKESWYEIPKIDERIEITETPTVKSVRSSSEYNKVIDSINIVNNIPQKYNSQNERALKNAIFTDGNLYCVQLSSWKTKSYADRELSKLSKRGYNAFLLSVKPKNKRSIWHRVRVGYFTTLEEAKQTQREINRR